jgi:DNA polymerase-3 subunit epsilon
VRSRPAAPLRSSRRKRWQDVELVALDFETTGLDLHRDAVISFGLVPVSSGRIDLGRALYQEVAPSAPISHGSIAVHHLRPADLAEAPPLEEVLGHLRTALEGRFLLTWSAEIEATFLARTFGGRVRGWLARSVDVLRLAVVADRIEGRSLPGDAYSLAETVARAGLPVEEAHDAMNDALMTAEMFLVVAAHLGSYGFTDVRSLLRTTRKFPQRLLRGVSCS